MKHPVILNDISNCRLASQNIMGAKSGTPQDIVGLMGAMQAQDYNMAKWAIGVRSSGSTDREIEDAFNRGEILRTHLLRPTWHFVSADDIYWMLELTAPRIKASLKARHGALGITEEFIIKCKGIIRKALSGGNHLTRDELVREIEENGIPCSSSQAYHFLMLAELDGIICSGASKGKEHTYALLAERVPMKKALNLNEALAELSRRYFTSHGPATLQDFSWWSGLSVTDTKKSLEMVGASIVAEKTGSQTYWFSRSISSLDIKEDSVFLLPAYDEFIISYKDRSPSISIREQEKAVSSNGVFRPIIVVNGQVAGLWKRMIKKDKIVIGIKLFQTQGKKVKSLIEEEISAYGLFLEKQTEILW
jgi:hypothetical protein